MSALVLEVNDLVQVEFPGRERETHPSRVEDVRAGTLVIAWPARRGHPVSVSLQQTLRLYFVREDVLHGVTTRVEKRTEAPLPLLTLRVTGRPEKVQRRQFFRVRHPLPVRLVNSSPGPGEEWVIETHAEDISGAGIGIRYEMPVAVGTLFLIRFVLKGELPALSFEARVVSCEPRNVGELKSSYHIGLCFVGITESQRSRIVRYLAQVQRRSLRAGL